MKVTISPSDPEPTDELVKLNRNQAIVHIAMENLTQALAERLPQHLAELTLALENDEEVPQKLLLDPIGELLLRSIPVVTGREASLQDLRAAPLGDALLAQILRDLEKRPDPKRWLKIELEWMQKGVPSLVVQKGIELYLTRHYRATRPPRGWMRWKGRFILNKPYRRAIERAVSLHAEGLSFRKIAAKLKLEGKLEDFEALSHRQLQRTFKEEGLYPKKRRTDEAKIHPK